MVGLLCAKHCSKNFSNVGCSNPENDSRGYFKNIFILYILYTENQNQAMLKSLTQDTLVNDTNLPNITQLY